MQETQVATAVDSINEQVTAARKTIQAMGCQLFILRPHGNGNQFIFLSLKPQPMKITGSIAEIPELIKSRNTAAGFR